MAETVAGGPAESELEEAVQALSAAAITVSKSAERLLVIAVTIEGLRDRKNTRLHRSSVVALARRRCSSRPNAAGRSSPASFVARNVSSFASMGGSNILQSCLRMSVYGSEPRGLSRNAESFRSVSESSLERT